MKTTRDFSFLHGRTIVATELAERDNGRAVRLHLDDGSIRAIGCDGDGQLDISDETSIP